MKTLNYIISCLLVLFTTACNDDINFTKGDIPRDVAYKLALKKLDVSLKDVDIWATKEKLPANTIMKIFHFELTSPATESWFFFIDEIPMGNWGHDCQYAFVDMNGKVHIHQQTMPPSYEKYNMERINISEVTKNYEEIYHAPSLTYKIENGYLNINIHSYMENCGAEKIEINFDRMKEDFIPVEITEIGKESANCIRPTDFSFSIPYLTEGKTYHCDIRSKSVGGPIHLPLFDFTFTMEEGANGKIKR